jgi:hypothetical protein
MKLRVGVTSIFIAGHGICAYSTKEKDAIIVTKNIK